MLDGLRQRFKLLWGLALMDEITTLQLQDDLVDGVEQVGHAPGERIFDEGDRIDIRRLAQINRYHRPGHGDPRGGRARTRCPGRGVQPYATPPGRPSAANHWSSADPSCSAR